ncbi:hypothetical protein HPP92_011251 [Vanilla planifolia]|uniref:EF-hand domain-containing protein n=1 Tax=Vanilla planifolia TaxID=51239 RepID=A0A835R5N6_VANPL|nr:hypothetical protein HPP92_011251 [Vanilla planifolia]
MEKISRELIGFLIVEAIFLLLKHSHEISLRILSLLACPSYSNAESTGKGKQRAEAAAESEVVVKATVSGADVALVMEKMGLSQEQEVVMEELWGPEEIAALFQEQGASIEEAKEAFAVFDENRDGYVDAGELQRALCRLGFGNERDCFGLDSCRNMIAVHDENRDGLIDFNEFFKMVECSFN